MENSTQQVFYVLLLIRKSWRWHTFIYSVFELKSNRSDLWSWESHVQFSADGYTGNFLVMSTENLHRPGRQTAGESTLWDKKKKEKENSYVKASL